MLAQTRACGLGFFADLTAQHQTGSTDSLRQANGALGQLPSRAPRQQGGGDYAQAASWSTLGLEIATGPSLSRVASMQAILAMADHQLGRDDEARAELADCQQVIAEHFKPPFATADIAFDWFLARLLEREAAASMENSPPAPE